MKRCPKCNFEIKNKNAKFCNFCGYELKKRTQKIVIGFISFFIIILLLFAGALIWNINFEKKNLQPYTMNGKLQDYNVTITVSYDKNEKDTNIEFLSDNIIESWQVALSKELNLNKNDMFVMVIETPEKTYNLPPTNVVFESNKKFTSSYNIPDSNIKEFLKIKTSIKNDKFSYNYFNLLGFNIKERKEKKEEYYRIKEQQRQQELLREQFYNYFWGNY